ncbi:hypothetical protein DYQ86_16305 [Acidobacteria bacterium AB60]|nr:hypothetical protein DYQ86_16305 [Acidobacteria bacterium AB60]
MVSHEHPQFCNPDYPPIPLYDMSSDEDESPVYCAVCHDFEVEHEEDLCSFCAIEALCGLEVAENWLDTPAGKRYLRERWEVAA